MSWRRLKLLISKTQQNGMFKKFLRLQIWYFWDHAMAKHMLQIRRAEGRQTWGAADTVPPRPNMIVML